MKPGPEHINAEFLHRKRGERARLTGIFGDVCVLEGAWTQYSTSMEDFDREWDLVALAKEKPKAPPATPLAAIPALLSRLLAAGFDDVELALRSTRDIPAPTYRLIGYWESERISYTQVFADEGDLGRIEAVVMEKLEALKAERTAKGEP